jgi:hypothetical protein
VNAPKLTEAQRAFLRDMAIAPRGTLYLSDCGGMSWQKVHVASAFYRTGRALVRKGLAIQPESADGSHVLEAFKILDGGRVELHCNDGLRCIARGGLDGAQPSKRSCICGCSGCDAAGRAALRGES